MKKLVLALLIFTFANGCTKINITSPSPLGYGANTNTNTNTNNNTNNNTINVSVDRTGSDTGPAGTPTSTPNGSGVNVLPLPGYGETIAAQVAASNPNLLNQACQDRFGEPAWAYLDLLVRTLRAQDQRWGYLCKDGNCVTYGRDVITYRASTGDTGIWIVDVIFDVCGTNSPQWLVLPFDLTRRWSPVRTAGAF